MPNFLSRILGSSRKAAQRGLVYVPLTDDGPLAGAAPGKIVRTASPGPPWIVVDHSIESVTVARWPGKLWDVEIIRAASEQPRDGAGYTRALAVRVLGELPVAMLFGPHGADVVRVIETAAALNGAQAEELGARSTELARDAFSRAWRAWIAKMAPGSIHRDADHANTLAVFAGGTRSPIGGGFTVIHSVLGERARTLVGDAAYTPGDDDELFLAPPWGDAADALVHAAMAFGAPELLPDSDRRTLTEAWEHCFGR